MNSSTFKFSAVFASVTTALMVSACGGGGGGSTDSANNGGGNNGGGGGVSTCSNGASDYPSCTQLQLQTSVPAATYPANSVELQAFTELNAVRQKLGLGLLTQNAQLDTAAKNHVNYVVLNLPNDRTAYGHSEKQGNPGYTGGGPSDRAKYAGFLGTAGEVIGGPNDVDGLSPTYDLLNTVAHAQNLLDQCSTDIGIGFLPMFYQGYKVDPVVYNNGMKNNNLGLSLCQKNVDSFSFNYPYDGQINVPRPMTPETPNPIPDLPKDQFGNDDWANGTSAPIIIGFEKSKTIETISVTVSDVSTNTVVPMRVMWWNSSTYPNPYKSKYLAFFVGYKPFKSQTKYQVNLDATVDGVKRNKVFSFTTK